MQKPLNLYEYIVYHELGTFKVLVSQHAASMFVGGILYYDKKGSWAENKDATLDFKLHTIIGQSQKQCYDNCLQWIDSNLGKDYNITPNQN